MSGLYSQPKEQDAVLGTQILPPINSASLGGIEGIWQRFTKGDVEQRMAALTQAIAYPKTGVDVLIAALQDPVLEIRAAAYELLRSVNSDQAKEAIADGIWVKPGDRVYGVYKSAIRFDDEWFHLDPDFQNLDFIDEIDWSDLGYESYEDFVVNGGESYSGGEMESYIPRRVAYYLSKEQAETAAEKLHQKLVNEWDCHGEFELKFNFIFHEWCKENHVQYIGNYDYLYELRDELRAVGNYELLGKLWRDSVGSFSFVLEETVNELQYLRF